MCCKKEVLSSECNTNYSGHHGGLTRDCYDHKVMAIYLIICFPP